MNAGIRDRYYGAASSTPVAVFTTLLRLKNAHLKKLSQGRSVSFEETRVSRLRSLGIERRTMLRWDCDVRETRHVSVPAGDFDTFHVVCNARRSGFFLPLQTVTWDYAPSLGHYVRRTWYERGRPRQSQLAAALPGALATAPRVAATLERLQQMQQP